MNRGTAFWRELFLTRLSSESTIIVRDVVAEVLGRKPTSSEMNAARKASHYVAEAGQAVLMGLYPREVRGEDHSRPGERRVSCLTADDALVRRLPFCVERSATQQPGWWKDKESEAFKQAQAATRPERERALAMLLRR
ncbi:hypothetical protein [Streptosporangium lutulentum]|uniref:Uncharacterized protein n=1 Tax=Streptosporangium lutulentum TaxID=1461250 RepID=A0ABT9QKX0_9ACTN|nr:hypothetical protein [Streptosporangium lutulentum]MDP9847379.1 hypothetical protein [Streptosporangium lutulentum]